MNSFWVTYRAVERGGLMHRPGVEYELATVVRWDASNRIFTVELYDPPRRHVAMYDMAYRDLNMGTPREGQRVVLRAVTHRGDASFVLVGFSLLEDGG